VGETGGKDFIVAHPTADAEAVATAFGATPEGNWEGTNVLWRPLPLEAVASETELDPEELAGMLKQQVRDAIGPIAMPDRIQIVPGLPKTRSGKIMRRILRKIAAAEYDQLGDVTTLADPTVVEKIVEGHRAAGA